MIIHNPVITGSLQVNGTSVSSIAEVDNISGSVVTLTDASASLAAGKLNNTTDTLTGDLTVTGKITAQEFHTEFVSASIVYQSGSTKFGDSSDDIHSFTGSVNVFNVTSGVTGSYDFQAANFTISGDDADLNLNITSGSSIANLAEFRFQVDGGTMGRLYMHKGTKHMYIGPTYFPTSSLYLQDGTGTVMSITGSRVSVGGTAPKARLQVVNPTNQQTVPTAGSGNVQGMIVSNDLDTYGMMLGSIGNGDGYIQQQRTDSATYYDLLLQPNGGSVGVGGEPTYQFQIINSANSILALTAGTADNEYAQILFGDAATPAHGRIRYENFTDSLQIITNSSPAMLINSSGNIGIGTTDPVNILHIEKSVDSDLLLEVDNQNTGTSSAAGIVLRGQGNNLFIRSYGDGTSTPNINDFRTTAGGGTLTFTTGGSERLRITSGGNVGINTAGPRARLEVLGENFAVTNSGRSVGGIHIASDSNDGAGTYSGGISFAGPGSGAAAISGVQGTTDGDTQGLAFFTHDSGTGANDSTLKMLLNYQGNLGIGTPSPDGRLTISAGAENQTAPVNAIRIKGPNVPMDANSSQNISWDFSFAGSAKIRAWRGASWGTTLDFLTNTPGAGSDVPGVRMSVTEVGQIQLPYGNPSSLNAGEGVITDPGTFTGMKLYGSSDGNLKIFNVRNNSSFGNILFLTGTGTERMRVTYDGKTGIGTTAVYARHHVFGSTLQTTAVNDPDIVTSVSGGSDQDGGVLSFFQGWAATTSNGDSIVFQYNATNWKSWSLEYTISSTNGVSKGIVGGYSNGSPSGVNHNLFTTDEHGVSVSVTTNEAGNGGDGTNQSLRITFTFSQLGVHPNFRAIYTQSGGDGVPRAERARISLVS